MMLTFESIPNLPIVLIGAAFYFYTVIQLDSKQQANFQAKVIL